MKPRFVLPSLLLSLAASLAVLVATGADAALPRTLHHQGRLSSTTGAPLQGAYNFTFRLYDVASGGAALWTENQNGVATDTEGLYAVVLGSVTPLSLAFDTTYYLSIEIGGAGEMSPRQALGAAPYALRAAIAESLPAGLTIGRITSSETISASYFSGNGAGLTNVAITSVVGTIHVADSTVGVLPLVRISGDTLTRTQMISYTDALRIHDSTVGVLPFTRVSGDTVTGVAVAAGDAALSARLDAVRISDSTTQALPFTRVSGDTITGAQARALTWSLADSTTGALPLTRLSGDTISRLEVLTTRFSLADSTIGTLAGDSVAAARSQLNVDSPTLVVDAANNRVGIDSSAPAAALSVGGSVLALDTVTARVFVGSGSALTGVSASSVNAPNINGPIHLADSTTASLPVARVNGAINLVDSTTGALPVTRISGDTITGAQARALTWSLVDSTTGSLPAARVNGSVSLADSTSGALPLTRVSGDTITRLEVLTTRVNLADSTIGTIAGDSVSAARSQLNVDSPTLVVDAANNRVGIDSSAPAAALSVGGSVLALDTVTARAFVGSGSALTGVSASTVNAPNIVGPIHLADSTTASLPVSRVNGAISLVDSTTGALPVTRISGDTITGAQARALTWSLVDSTTGSLPAARVNGSVSLADSTSGALPLTRVSGDTVTGTAVTNADAALSTRLDAVRLTDSTVQALPFTRVFGDTITGAQARALTWSLVDSTTGSLPAARVNGSVSLADSTSGALPLTRISGDTITRLEVLTLTVNLVDSTSGALPITRVSGDTLTRAQMITYTDALLGDSVAAARSQLNVDSPTLVVDAANNRIGIGTSVPADSLSVVGSFSVDSPLFRVDAAADRVGINVAGAPIAFLHLRGYGDNLLIEESDAPANEQRWLLKGEGGAFEFLATDDAWSAWNPVFRIHRTGTTLDSFAIDDPTFIVDHPNDRVGIGTKTPQERLHVALPQDGGVGLYLRPATWDSLGDSVEIRYGDPFHYIRGTWGRGMDLYDVDGINLSGGNMGFDSPTLVINSTDNRIGIDSNAPVSALGVNGTVTATAFVGSGTGLTGLPSSPWSGASGDSLFVPAGTEVGIGTNTPVDSLHVVGGIRVDSGMRVDGNTFIVDAANNRVSIGTNASNHVLEVAGTAASLWDTVRIYNANLLVDSGFLVMKTNSFFDGAWNTYPKPIGSFDDAICLYATDTGFGAELMVRDENGNVTCLSPHDFSIAPRSEPLSWSFWSMNERLGGTINVDMLKVVRLVERLTGQKLVHIAPSGTNPEVDVEALERYLENGGATVVVELDRLEAENVALKMSIAEMMRRIEALEAR